MEVRLCSTNSTQPISTTLQGVVDTDKNQPTPVEPLVPKVTLKGAFCEESLPLSLLKLISDLRFPDFN